MLNTDGKHVFYSDMNNMVYKIDINGKENAELIYEAPDVIQSILTFDNGVLISTDTSSVFIKQDGTEVKLDIII